MCSSDLRVVHNPVDLERFSPERADPAPVRAELGLGAETPLLAVVAQITPWKGQDTAIEALALLRERGRDAHLALVGSAKFVDKATRFDNEAYTGALERLTADLGLADRVSFLGERRDVPVIMAAAEVLLMPSWQEPFGRAIIEAMAVGTPVLATDVGGPPEVVEQGVEGELVPPRQPERWADSLESLLGDRERLARMGAAGIERARGLSVERHAEAIVEIYRSLVPAPRLVVPG